MHVSAGPRGPRREPAPRGTIPQDLRVSDNRHFCVSDNRQSLSGRGRVAAACVSTRAPSSGETRRGLRGLQC